MSTAPASCHSLKFVEWIILAIAVPVFVTGAEVTRITVDAAQALGPVNRLVFGHNLEAADSYGVFSTNHTRSETGAGVWNPESGAPVPEAMRHAAAIGMPVVRYPGGCLVHGFDWKQTIGPVGERPQFRFGLDEFLAYCQVLKAMPLITVSDYTGTAQDAADLVEYLNAPADANHPWARKRAANGHPEPYGVRHFELGNESDHGNHDLKPPRKFAAEAYAEWVNAYAAKMRAVDPTLRLSALMGTGTGPDDPWNDVVLARTKGSVDFIAIHTYAVALWREEQVQPYPEAMLMRACMASVDQFEVMLGKYREKIRRHTGKDLPLAITEYNAAFVQEKPVPYRFSFAAALFAADYLRVLLKPEANVLMANYWQFINGYWGMVKCTRPYEPTKDQEWSVRPAYALYRLWGQHFGQVLLRAEVQNAPRVELPRHVGSTLPSFYEAVTAAGSRSADGMTVYVIVFNKHETEALPIEIDLRNFAPASAARWCVSSPSMAATNLVTNPAGFTDDSVKLEIVPGQSVSQTLPACSMTAFEFRLFLPD
jgi:alpha-N-arabinofuranosidase